jgi:putative membrane protein
MTDRIVFRIVFAVSIVVFLLVLVLNRRLIPAPANFPLFIYQLPKLHAFLNGTCSILLICSFIAIKNKKRDLHKKLNITAFLLSSLFLISYVTYHYLAGDTSFPAINPLRPVYLFILTSHIFLAAAVLPLILLSFYRGLQGQIEKHKKLVHWSFPIWLYVTITGVVVYLMISPYYAHYVH